jgi:hypothetical protein
MTEQFGVMIAAKFCRGGALLMRMNRQSASLAEFTTRKKALDKTSNISTNTPSIWTVSSDRKWWW